MKDSKVAVGATVALVAIGALGAVVASMSNAGYNRYEPVNDDREVIEPLGIRSEPEPTAELSDVDQARLEREREAQREAELQALREEVERERQLEAERERLEFVNRTTESWESLQKSVAAMDSIDFDNMERSEIVRTFGYYASEVASIPTEDIDSDLSRLVYDYQGVLSDMYSTANAYNQRLVALDRDESKAMLDGCNQGGNQAAAAGEDFWYQLGSCIGGGLLGAGGAIADEELNKSALNADFEDNFESISATFARVEERFTEMPELLEDRYGITTY